ncbi:MAG: hypothetical protein COY81_05125 [Candidatus Pacebacteria bacterium CG_4_10_14_0_8_um_filter_43_12]|nr:MAG: hypothetical protein COU66_02875 [Candidatus Pacebacteria bacterium CG10_big_fil_rev_8_21_14_0_10_44_11]PIY78933.1 MAG: hypothetical protein COY81_05125 [Candidatus Pacebacteria bacterium CG_4_10_14_0_8_um_filter_43_12]
MKLKPARETLILLSIFAVTIIVVFAGALLYKFNGNANIPNQEQSENISPQVMPPTARLVFKPTEKTNEYQFIVKDLTAPVTSIAFQLMPLSKSDVFVSKNLKLNQNLDNWTVAVNKVETADSSSVLSVSIINLAIENHTSEEEIILGTIKLDPNYSPEQMQINPEESFVTYNTIEEPIELKLDLTTN